MSESPSPLRLVKDDESKDEIDPELVKLKRRSPVGPLLAFSVFGFAAFLLVTLRFDFFYSLEGANPKDLGRAVDLQGALPDNQYVGVHGAIDHSWPGLLHGRQGAGYRLAPLMGTHGRFWVHEEGEAGLVTAAYDDRFTGRLRPLASQPYANELRAYVAGLPPQPRFVYASSLPNLKSDVYGDAIPEDGNLDVTVEQKLDNASTILMVATDDIKNQKAATAALVAAGIDAPVLEAEASTDTTWVYDVAVDPAAANDKLRAAKLFGAAASARTALLKAKLKDLKATDTTLTVRDQEIHLASIGHIVVFVPVDAIPSDAWVVVEGELPATFWYMRALDGVLAGVGLLMLWAGVRSLLGGRRARPRPKLVGEDA
jgi:hypothetical protein